MGAIRIAIPVVIDMTDQQVRDYVAEYGLPRATFPSRNQALTRGRPGVTLTQFSGHPTYDEQPGSGVMSAGLAT